MDIRNKKIVVTGGAGFVGMFVVKKLKERIATVGDQGLSIDPVCFRA